MTRQDRHALPFGMTPPEGSPDASLIVLCGTYAVAAAEARHLFLVSIDPRLDAAQEGTAVAWRAADARARDAYRPLTDHRPVTSLGMLAKAVAMRRFVRADRHPEAAVMPEDMELDLLLDDLLGLAQAEAA